MDISDEFIDAFLNHQLEPKAARDFEEQIRVNPELKKRVEGLILTRISVELHARQATREDLKVISKGYVKGGKAKGLALYWGMAASLTAVVALLAYLISKPAQMNPEQLFTAYFEPIQPKVLFNTSRRGAGDRLDTFVETWKKIGIAYEEGKYPQVKIALDTLGQDTSYQNRPDLQLARAWIYLQDRDAPSAIQLLLGLDSFSLSPHRDWFLALAYLQNKQIAEARASLLKLSQNLQSPYQAKAKQLLSKIR